MIRSRILPSRSSRLNVQRQIRLAHNHPHYWKRSIYALGYVIILLVWCVKTWSLVSTVPNENDHDHEQHGWIPDTKILQRMRLTQHPPKKNSTRNRSWSPILSLEYCNGMTFSTKHKESSSISDQDKLLIQGVPITVQNDRLYHKGFPSTSTVLCIIFTTLEYHDTQVRAIRETWASRCDGFLAFSTHSDPDIPAIHIPLDDNSTDDYYGTWQKVRSIWKYVQKHYSNQYDAFFLGDDSVFVIPENLKVYFSNLQQQQQQQYQHSMPESDLRYYIGRRFHFRNVTFNSGDAGYVLSRGTLNALVSILDDPVCKPTIRSKFHDILLAQCLKLGLNITVTDTRHLPGQQERFHPFTPTDHLNWRPPSLQKDWYQEYNQNWGVTLGMQCCAPDSISFHYISRPERMRHLYALIYQCD